MFEIKTSVHRRFSCQRRFYYYSLVSAANRLMCRRFVVFFPSRSCLVSASVAVWILLISETLVLGYTVDRSIFRWPMWLAVGASGGFLLAFILMLTSFCSTVCCGRRRRRNLYYAENTKYWKFLPLLRLCACVFLSLSLAWFYFHYNQIKEIQQFWTDEILSSSSIEFTRFAKDQEGK